MPLQAVAPTESALANAVAQQLVGQIKNLADRVNKVRTEGIAAVDEQPARQLPDGRVIPARPASPAVSAEAINAALGEENCALLDSLKAAIGV